jgi:predicted nucleotidyltransferase
VIDRNGSAEHLRYLPVPLGDSGFVSAEKIGEAVKQIVAIADPVRVIAFGSRARGDHQPHSDLDLAVVVDRYDPEVDRRPLWRSQIPVLMPIDVIVYDVVREREMSDALNSLQWVVAREGVTLYERDKGFNHSSVAERLV